MDEIAARAHAGKHVLSTAAGRQRRRGSSTQSAPGREEVAWLSISDTRSLQGHIEAPIANVPDLDEADNQQVAVVVGLAAAAGRDPEREDRALRRVGPSNCARPRRVH